MDLCTKTLAGFIAQVVLVLSISSGTTGEDVCDGSLVSNLPPSAFRSSSQLSNSHGPSFAKLNRREGAGGWSPLTSDTHRWLEVDLGERTTIKAVATQGRYGSSDWLTSYLLMFSDTGHNWRQYRQEESVGSFPGNTNADSVVQYKLQQPAVARFLRLLPLGWNPNGRIGLRMETYGCPYRSDVVSLDGSSSLAYVPGKRRASREVVSLKFKTGWNFGTLLFAEGAEGQSFGLELEKGKLLLLLGQGPPSASEPRRLASLGSLLDDQQWHHVTLERHDSQLNLTVDKHTERIQIPAELNHRNIQQLIVGGQHSHKSRRFTGCLENLLYNDVNLIGLAKRGDPQLSVTGNVTFSCAEPVSVAATFPGPQSFLQLPVETGSIVSVGFQFRTWNDEGLLLTFNLPDRRGVVWLTLSRAKLQLKIQKDEQLLLELSTGSGLSDGQWHTVALTSGQSHLSVSVDGVVHGSPVFPVAALGQLYFGGCPGGGGESHECINPFSVFQGCMRLLVVDHQPVDLVMVQQRLLGNYSQLQVDMCGIIDRCSPNHCEHGGVCSQTWTSFHCNCSESGYKGATCHSSVHQQSCEAYKHHGNRSGRFHVDVDGSGPIRPQLVYCNMTEGNTWMVIDHNNTELTMVRPSLGGNQHSIHLDYMVEEEQLLAAISQSEHCEQELAYHCRKSRLLNTPEGSPFSWWFGGPGLGHLQTYWGGAQPGSQQCSCGLQGDCVDTQHYCNCDGDRMEWYYTWNEDSGLLTRKDSLPVRSLLLGDVRRPGSEAAYRVGPLRCHGDKSFWNAAFFHKETSYLHFPTFHAELSADVSFLFKTNASSGVFLENLGIKDFIRIELSSSTQVRFSFDVGNGPLEVRVESSSPLNDDRWHRVQAERNMKEATLQVDDLPLAAQPAPADGHFHLQLNSQLFIGGTASRQKGFRGCIRSLQLNGATLDLEERARITPGVHPGCPGHCSSYGSLCRNHGRCVERDNGFTCDCSRSAYTGVFCHTEVSASFTPQTSVHYTFTQPPELTSNSSAAPSGENVSLSFRTSQSPALLLYVSSYYRQYLALLVNKHDRLEVRYKLDGSRAAQVWSSRGKSVADGQLHSLVLQRLTDTVWLQVDDSDRETFNLTSSAELSALKLLVLGRVDDSAHVDPDLAQVVSLGFSGCLSVVLFNRVSPLKAALLQPDSGAVHVSGPLLRSACGSAPSTQTYGSETTHQVSDPSGSASSGQPLVNTVRTDSALIGGLIAVVIFVLVTGLAVTARVLYRRKETYRNREAECAAVRRNDSQDFNFSSQSDARNHGAENPKEFFI